MPVFVTVIALMFMLRCSIPIDCLEFVRKLLKVRLDCKKMVISFLFTIFASPYMSFWEVNWQLVNVWLACCVQGNASRMVAKIAEASNTLTKRLGRQPSYDEIAEMLHVNILTVKLVSERSRPPGSLDRAVTDQGHMTLQVLFLNFIPNFNE